MKKLLFIIGVGVLLAVVWANDFYRKNLEGIWPAVLEPSEDIVELIEKFESEEADIVGTDNVSSPAESKTDFPLSLPDGFSISIFAKGLSNVRDLEWGPGGMLMASITDKGKVVGLPDKDGDGKADEIITFAEDLNKPHGLATLCDPTYCKIYVAEKDKVSVYDFDSESNRLVDPKKLVDLDVGGLHFTRSLLLHPDGGGLYISSGSSCNACEEKSWQRAKILSVNLDGSDFKEYAKGLRNSVFMTLHPVTGDLWATEMGRDLLGDDLPPDEINIIKEDQNYGWPTCYGQNIHDTDYDKNTYIRNPCMEPFEKASYIDIQAHSSPLGLAFIPEEGWPEEYRHDLLVAYHGSWNRTDPTGYKIVRFKLDEVGNYQDREDFISGWLTSDNKSLGRPVDILVQPGGVIYISDDKAGVIYKVTANANE